jgi:hypothetical protein
MSQRCITVPCAATGSSCTPPRSMEHANEASCCICGRQLLDGGLMCSILLLGVQAEKPDQRGAQQQELIAAQPSMPWNQILESLELTEHQRKVCNQGPGVSPQPQSQPCPDRNPSWCTMFSSPSRRCAELLHRSLCARFSRRHTSVTALRRGVCRRQMQTGLICFMQSLVAARNMVVQRLRAITDERRRLMAALHSFVLQVDTTQQIDHACNDSAAILVVYTVRAQASHEAMMRSCWRLCACAWCHLDCWGPHRTA